MKKLILILSLISSSVAFSGQPEGDVIIPGLYFTFTHVGECIAYPPSFAPGDEEWSAYREVTTYVYFGGVLITTSCSQEEC